jgi:hypothetical protein
MLERNRNETKGDILLENEPESIDVRNRKLKKSIEEVYGKRDVRMGVQVEKSSEESENELDESNQIRIVLRNGKVYNPAQRHEEIEIMNRQMLQNRIFERPLIFQ